MKVFTIVFLGIVAVSSVYGHSKKLPEGNPLAFLEAELSPLVSFVVKNYVLDWNYVIFKGEIPRESVSLKEYLKKVGKKHDLTLEDVVDEMLELIGKSFNETPLKKLNPGLKKLPIDLKAVEDALAAAFPKGSKKVSYEEFVYVNDAVLINAMTALIAEELSKLLF